MQPPTMQPPQMSQVQFQQMQSQPLQCAMPNQQMPDSAFLQQLMQMQLQPQMQPPPCPPLQPPALMTSEFMPAPPPPLTAIETAAPSILCPSTCHQAQVCRCGEVSMVGGARQPSEEQQQAPNARKL